MSCGCNDACNSSNELTIPTGTAGRNGLFGGWSQEYGFDTGTAVSPPTNKIRLNNATPASVTEIYVNDTNIDGVDTDAFLDAFVNGSNYGLIKLFKQHESNIFWMGEITNVVDNGSYHTLTVTHTISNSTFAADDNIVLSFTANGDPPDVYFVRTYAQLETLIAGSNLIPGATYVLSDYETEHQITGTATLNINSTGYVTKVEQLQLTAKSTTEFFHEAKSLNYPKDNILYDFTLNTVLSQARKGLIYWRKDNDKDIEAWYDTRNHIVARYSLNLVPITWSSGTIDRGQIVYQGSMLKTSIKDAAVVTASNNPLIEDVSQLMDEVATNNDITFSFDIGTSTTISPDVATITYRESITTTATNSIKLGYGVDDVLIDTCTNVTLEEGVTAFSIMNSNDVKIGADSARGVINSCDGAIIGKESTDIHLRSSTNINFKSQASEVIMRGVEGFTGGYKVSKLLVHNSDENTVGDSTSSVMLVRKSDQNTIGTDCSGITFGNARGNALNQKCQDIEIYMGKSNRFGQYCSSISFLGETATGVLAGTYSNYASMSYNTFGSGCSNITFDTLGGRGNTFGDECKNLAFTTVGQGWRLIGCDFCRGIQNKTFQTIIHSVSFVVPDQITTTITTDDWYAQILKNHTSATNETATSGGVQGTQNDNFVAGHNKNGGTMPAFQVTGAGSAALQSAAGNITEAQTKLVHINSRAFMWTVEGYPLSMTLQNYAAKQTDPTASFYVSPTAPPFGYEDLYP
jgi:hypothetical protein